MPRHEGPPSVFRRAFSLAVPAARAGRARGG